MQGTVLLSKPFDIIWGGFRASSIQLQQMGWELSAEQDYSRYGLRIALRHREHQMYGISEVVEVDYFDRSYATRLPPVHILNMGSKVQVILRDDLSAFTPIDAMPQVVPFQETVKDIEDFSIFATPLVRTEEIIVEPQTVAECLEHIKRIQLPEQAAIRERNRLREAREGREVEAMPRQKFHAQILSIA